MGNLNFEQKDTGLDPASHVPNFSAIQLHINSYSDFVMIGTGA
jgi:hypothetical protein